MIEKDQKVIKQSVILTSVYFPFEKQTHRHDARDDNLVVDLQDNEWAVSVESVLPNPSIGAGVRVWIGSLSYD